MLIVIFCGITNGSNAAIIYDLGGDWAPRDGIGANPNGTWSIGRNPGLDPADFILNTAYSESHPPGSSGWYNPETHAWGWPASYPMGWHLFEGGPIDGVIFAGETAVQMYPGGDPDVPSVWHNLVYRWTAPAAGIIDISAAVLRGYGQADPYVLHNGTVLATWTGVGSYSASGIVVAAGDTIDFLFEDYLDYSTLYAVEETITWEIPEPASLVLLALGSVVLCRRRH